MSLSAESPAFFLVSYCEDLFSGIDVDGVVSCISDVFGQQNLIVVSDCGDGRSLTAGLSLSQAVSRFLTQVSEHRECALIGGVSTSDETDYASVAVRGWSTTSDKRRLMLRQIADARSMILIGANCAGFESPYFVVLGCPVDSQVRQIDALLHAELRRRLAYRDHNADGLRLHEPIAVNDFDDGARVVILQPVEDIDVREVMAGLWRSCFQAWDGLLLTVRKRDLCAAAQIDLDEVGEFVRADEVCSGSDTEIGVFQIKTEEQFSRAWGHVVHMSCLPQCAVPARAGLDALLELQQSYFMNGIGVSARSRTVLGDYALSSPLDGRCGMLIYTSDRMRLESVEQTLSDYLVLFA